MESVGPKDIFSSAFPHFTHAKAGPLPSSVLPISPFPVQITIFKDVLLLLFKLQIAPGEEADILFS